MSSSLTGNLEGSVEINASAKMFHDMLLDRPHHMPNASADKVHGCEKHEGEWGKEGTIFSLNFTHDGKAKHAKDLILSVDPKNYSSTFKVVDGHLLEEYKSFIIKVKATPCDKGEGCVVNWEIEYEKLHEGIAHPETFLALLIEVTKDMGSHLVQPK